MLPSTENILLKNIDSVSDLVRLRVCSGGLVGKWPILLHQPHRHVRLLPTQATKRAMKSVHERCDLVILLRNWCKLWPEKWVGINHPKKKQKSVPGSRESQCKGPGAGIYKWLKERGFYLAVTEKGEWSNVRLEGWVADNVMPHNSD